MEITLSEPEGPYECTIDPGVMQVTLKKVFLGVALITEDGSRLSVSMRDDGFEVHYHGKDFDAGWTNFKSNRVYQG